MGEIEAVPVEVDGLRVYVEARGLDDTSGGERPIGIKPSNLDQALDGLMGVAKAMGARLRETGAGKANVEFGCEFALESGSLVAVIGKASGKSTLKVTLEWVNPTAG